MAEQVTTSAKPALKVLLTHHYFPPDFAGGGERVALETARGLIQRGVDLRVLTTGDPKITQYEGIPTERIPIHRYRFYFESDRIAEMARDADLIQTFNYHACWPSLKAAKRLGKPVVCGILGLFQGDWTLMRRPLVAPLWSWIERRMVLSDYARVQFFSEHSRKLGLSLGVPAERTVVTHPGIDLSAYAPANPKEDIVFFCGKLDHRKGVDCLFDVARRLPRIRFRAMGWGPNEESIRRSAPPNVEFVPFDSEALCRAFGRARIYFSPSRAETFGIALVEAMASGCAIVSSVPLEFAGFQVNPGDNAGMADAIGRLWADRDAAARMGRRNVELAQQYNWNRYTNILMETYASVLGGR
jgi:glycosyltransferase involved in cell wall biosynthesis